MSLAPLFKSAVKAPVLAVAGVVLGLLFCVLLVLANLVIHVALGIEHGQVSHLVQAIAKSLPLIFGLSGFAAAFMTDAPLPAVFGSARWASVKQLRKLAALDDGLLIGRDPATDKLLRYDGPAHLLTMAPTRTGMRLPEDRMILLRQDQRPAWVKKLRYYADPEFNGAFDPA